jgi:hypothetical protein
MKRLIALLALIWLALPAIANAQVATVNTTNENLTVVPIRPFGREVPVARRLKAGLPTALRRLTWSPG